MGLTTGYVTTTLESPFQKRDQAPKSIDYVTYAQKDGNTIVTTYTYTYSSDA